MFIRRGRLEILIDIVFFVGQVDSMQGVSMDDPVFQVFGIQIVVQTGADGVKIFFNFFISLVSAIVSICENIFAEYQYCIFSA